MSATIDAGASYGRWTVIRSAPPRQRYGENYARSRALVRCICGHEQAVFVSDLKAGKTGGCRSLLCWGRWNAARQLLGGGGGV